MTTSWKCMSVSNRKRLKQDLELFQIAIAQWREAGDQYSIGMALQSALCAGRDDNRVAIATLLSACGLTARAVATLLHTVGVSHQTLQRNCRDPDVDALLGELVAIENLRTQGAIHPSMLRRREDRRPYILTIAFLNEVANSGRRYDPRTRTFVPNC